MKRSTSVSFSQDFSIHRKILLPIYRGILLSRHPAWQKTTKRSRQKELNHVTKKRYFLLAIFFSLFVSSAAVDLINLSLPGSQYSRIFAVSSG